MPGRAEPRGGGRGSRGDGAGMAQLEEEAEAAEADEDERAASFAADRIPAGKESGQGGKGKGRRNGGRATPAGERGWSRLLERGLRRPGSVRRGAGSGSERGGAESRGEGVAGSAEGGGWWSSAAAGAGSGGAEGRKRGRGLRRFWPVLG
jgi:hypothetical protein